MYNWQLPHWPNFVFDEALLLNDIHRYELAVSFLAGRFSALSVENQLTVVAENLVTEAIHTSRIEGENYSQVALKSSVLNNLDPTIKNRNAGDKRAAGLARLLTENRKNRADSLTEVTLFHWHELLLGHRKDLSNIGHWRSNSAPMQIISGPYRKERIHFEAPPSQKVPGEMRTFLKWYNEAVTSKYPAIITSAIAHLYFESIHPFEDGNGRIGRVISERTLGYSLQSPLPFSLSHAINKDVNEYYLALQAASIKLDLNDWLSYFIKTCLLGVQLAEGLLTRTIFKGNFYRKFQGEFSSRQEKAIQKMLAAGPDRFQGGMTAKKYGSINRVSRATATRDLQELRNLGALIQQGAGRSIHFVLPNTV